MHHSYSLFNYLFNNIYDFFVFFKDNKTTKY